MEAQKKRSAIQPEEIIAHLQVLATFHKLKLDVQARAPHNPIGLWTAFLGYAVEKFASWISNVVDKEGSDEAELTDEEFPTLDVAMVWHAYILNPVEYHHDCQKSQKGLSRIKAFPVRRLAEVIDTLGLEPRFPVPAFGSRGVRIGPQFSIDLVAAVKRQASFIAQVAAVGWTQRPKSLGSTINTFIDRYHCFLKKLWENPKQLVVSTLEIDLAWHTHQLNVETYRKDSMMLFGRILQHDDDLPSSEMNRAFKRNSLDWRQNLFHMDYSTGSIYNGLRPLSSSTPDTPVSPNRPLSMENSRTDSEISLQEVYRAVSEKRLSDVPSSFYSLSPPSSSGRGSTPSPSASPIVGTPSSASGNDSPPHRGSMIMMLQPTKNDSTSTISPIPPNIGLDNPSVALITDSRASSSSELSSMFAYKPPMGFHDGRGAFDRPPASGIVGINNLHAHNANSVSYGGSSRRPASAGNPSPLRPALKRPRHHTSNSTGTLYVPEMPSPLSQPPKLSIVDQSQNPQSSSQSLPHTPYTSSLNLSAPMTVTMARKISMGQQTADNLSRSSSVGLRSKMGPPTAYRDRPSSSGKSSTLSPPAAAVPKRPSTAGGAFTMSLKDSSLSVPPSRVASSGNTTAQNRANTITKGPVSISKGFPKASGRPSTAPHPTPKGRSEELSRSSSFFKKKPKAEKSTPQKRSWFRFW